MTPTPPMRIRAANGAPVNPGGEYVLYWMVAFRRLGSNFALQRAVELGLSLDRPLVILEALRVGYRWASDRLHRFALDGMAEHARLLKDTARPLYYPYVEPEAGSGKGLVHALGSRACIVVSDDTPAFFLPRMLARAGQILPVRLELVDSNGLLPLRATSRAFTTAYSFRQFLQRTLPDHLVAVPTARPLEDARLPELASLPEAVVRRWPAAAAERLAAEELVAGLPIDHRVLPASARGGSGAARVRLAEFLDRDLDRYAEARNHPDLEATSRLSPYLHWGHLSVHEVFSAVSERERWSPGRLSQRTDGRRQGWWGMGPNAEAFLDELVTWRELSCNSSVMLPGYERYESLPEWAQRTLADHEADRRPAIYDLDDFENARTHDELWNAAQRELLLEGRIHNYLRMLWGKKILEWTQTPREALDVMVELNNKYALDGRDPNSYGGIFWTLGRYDRGWPERPVYGKVRSMTSESTRRKVRVDDYLERFGAGGPGGGSPPRRT